MAAILQLEKVTKLYGSVRGVEQVSLEVEEGSVFGFLGPNGAGKTTTISMLVNLIKPTSGKITIFGKNAQTDGLHIRSRIGFLAGDMALDRGLTGRQQLEYFGNLRGGFDKKYVRELASRLDCKLDRKFRTLSRGNKQKVGLIAALMHKPELLILDEPTSGLDPLIQAEFNKIILEHKARGGTVFISSHVLSEVQELCDQVAFIRQGKLIANKPLAEITKGAPKDVRIVTPEEKLIHILEKLRGVSELKYQNGVITFSYSNDINRLLHVVSAYDLHDMTISDVDLETVFMKYYEGGK